MIAVRAHAVVDPRGSDYATSTEELVSDEPRWPWNETHLDQNGGHARTSRDPGGEWRPDGRLL
jgi:hypothetical protein